jgi:PAS domain-containing protein
LAPANRRRRFHENSVAAPSSTIVSRAAEASMNVNTQAADDMLRVAIRAMRAGGSNFPQVLDGLPAAIYITDAEGVVTHYNRACIAFAGRAPRIGEDVWCVTWRLYTEEGEYLPHDRCPMAVAIRERRAIRRVRAVAERPDGTHVCFQPYPTPLMDGAGNLVAAINLLAEVTDRRQAGVLRVQAARCRRLVNLWPNRQRALIAMAEEYDRKALAIERQD